jgi:hypothetical protein
MVEQSFGTSTPSASPAHTSHQPATYFFNSFQGKVMKRIKKIKWQVGYWLSLYWGWWVGARWRRLEYRVRRWLVGRAADEVRMWRAMGCPAEWRPRREFRRLWFVYSVRAALGVGALLFGPWLLGLALRWLF